MTCPLIHCGFQNSNLIELWKHVTWHHAGVQTASSSSRPAGFNHPSDQVAGMKVDPVMMGIIERFALEQQQHQLGEYTAVGLQIDDFDAGCLGQPRSLAV